MVWLSVCRVVRPKHWTDAPGKLVLLTGGEEFDAVRSEFYNHVANDTELVQIQRFVSSLHIHSALHLTISA